MTFRISQFYTPQMLPPSQIDLLLNSINNGDLKILQVQERFQNLKQRNETLQPQTLTTQSPFLEQSDLSQIQKQSQHQNANRDPRIKTNCKNALQNIKRPVVKYLRKKGYNQASLEAFQNDGCNYESFLKLFKDRDAQPILCDMFNSRYLKRQYLLLRCRNKNKILHLYRIRELEMKFRGQVLKN